MRIVDPTRTYGLIAIPARSRLLAPFGVGLDLAKIKIAAGIRDTSELCGCGSCLIVLYGRLVHRTQALFAIDQFSN